MLVHKPNNNFRSVGPSVNRRMRSRIEIVLDLPNSRLTDQVTMEFKR